MPHVLGRWLQVHLFFTFIFLSPIFVYFANKVNPWCNAGGYSSPFFCTSLPKRCMYVLYQQTIIWVFPVLSTIEKKAEKKVRPPILPFLGGKRWNLFSHLFSFLSIHHYSMNSCGMWNISLINIKKMDLPHLPALPWTPCRPAKLYNFQHVNK